MLRNVKYDAQDLWDKDHDHVIHPWTNYAEWDTRGSDIMAQAEGIHVYDTEGNKFIDGIGGLWCVNIGYGREEMAQAIADQVRRIAYYSPVQPPRQRRPHAELGGQAGEPDAGRPQPRVLRHRRLDGQRHGRALRPLLLQRLGKPTKKHIITREDAYHGSTYLAALADRHAFDKQRTDQPTVRPARLRSPNPYRRPDGMTVEEFRDCLVEDLRTRSRSSGRRTSPAFIAEPIMGAGGVIVPPPGYHKRTLEVCRKLRHPLRSPTRW